MDDAAGFSLIELLIVVVILGILATVTVIAVRGVTDKGNSSSCSTDRTTLQTASEAYLGQYGVSEIATDPYPLGNGSGVAAVQSAVPAVTVAVPLPSNVSLGWSAGATPGDTLVRAGLLRNPPTNFFLRADGRVVTLNASCGAVGTVS